MRLSRYRSALLLACASFAPIPCAAADLVTHLFPRIDGELHNAGANRDTVLHVAAGGSIAWAAYQTGGADLSLTTGSKVTLFIDSVYSPGWLKVYALTSAVTPQDIEVQDEDVAFDEMDPIDSISMGSSDHGKTVRLDLGNLLSAGTFHGLAFVGNDGLEADLGSANGHLQPLIELKYGFATPAQVADAIGAGSEAASSAAAAAGSAITASAAATNAASAATAAASSASAASTSATAASASASSASTSAGAASTSASAASASASSASTSATAASSSASAASSSATSAASSASSASTSASAASTSATAAAQSAIEAAFAGQVVLSFQQTPPTGYSQTGIMKPFETPWVSKTSGTSRYDVGSTAYNGKLYVGGGYNGSYLTTFQAYDPATNAWTSLAGLPASTHTHAMGETGGKLYSIGGIQSSSVTAANYQYDPALNSWSTKTSLPKALCCPSVVGYGGKIHVFGGCTNTLATANVTDHFSYNPSTNTWDTLAALSEAKSQVMTVVSGSKIHIFGGIRNDGSVSNVHQVYDPSSNTWSSAAACPNGMRYGGAMAKDGVIYVITSFGGPVYEYDTVLDSWTKLADNITPRYGFGYGLIGSAIYISQGYAGGIIGTTEAYTLPKNIYYLKRD